MGQCSSGLLPEGCESASSNIFYDGQTFSCLDFGDFPTINKVIEVIGNKLCQPGSNKSQNGQITSNDIIISGSNGVTLSVYLESLQQLISEIETPSVEVDICGTIVGSCISIPGALKDCIGFGLSQTDTYGDFFSYILQSLCSVHTQADNIEAQLYGINSIVYNGGNAVLDPNGGTLTSSPSSLNVSVGNPITTFSKYLVDGKYVQISSKDITLPANSDSYIEVTKTGSYYVISVANGAPVPDVQTGNRIWKAVTNGSGVVSSADQRATRYLPVGAIPLESITADLIADGAIGSDALEDIVVAATVGVPGFIEIGHDAKGRVVSAVSDIDFTGIINNDILRWNSATSRFVLYNLSSGSMPSGTSMQTMRYNGGGSTWVGDSFIKNTGALASFGSEVSAPGHYLHVGRNGKIALETNLPSFSLARSSGGSLSASTTYYYRVSFVDASGFESSAAAQQSVATTVSDRTAVITFGNVPTGIQSVRVWRSTTNGVHTDFFNVAVDGKTSFNDTGIATSAGTIPTAHASSGVYVSKSGISIGNTPWNTGALISSVSNDALIDSPHFFKYSAFGTNGFALTAVCDSAAGMSTNKNVAIRASAENGGGSNIAVWAEHGSILVADDLACDSPNVGIQLHSTSKAIQFSRMTTLERDAVTWGAPDYGIVIYNKTDNKLQVRLQSGAWENLH